MPALSYSKNGLKGRTMARGSTMRVILGLGISALCMYLALRGANLAEVTAVVSAINPMYFLPMTSLLIGAFVLRAIRWKVLLEPVKTISVRSLFASTMIGFMANNVLPFRAGEIVRAYSISRNESISVSSSLASLIVERIFDGVVISLFMLPLVFFVSFPVWMVNVNYGLLVMYVLLIGAAIVLIWRRGRKTSGEGGGRWDKAIGNFTAGLEVCTNRRQIVWSGFLSLAHWLAIASYYYLLFLACGLRVPFLGAMVLVVTVAIGIMVPAAPGYVGNFEYFTVLGLSLFSVPKGEALGYSLVAHAGQFIPVTAIGLLYLFRQSAGLSQLDVRERQRA